MVNPELHHLLRLEVYSHWSRDVTRERAVALSNQYNVLPEVLAPTLQFTTRKDENRSHIDRRPGDAHNISSDYQRINFDKDTFYAFTDTKKSREHFRNSPRAPSRIPWPCLWHLRTLSYLSEQRGQIFRNKPQRRVVERERGQQRTVYSGFVARDDTPGVLVMSGGRWGLLGMRILHLFTLRLQNFTSVFLRLLRSARVCKRVINP